MISHQPLQCDFTVSIALGKFDQALLTSQTAPTLTSLYPRLRRRITAINRHAETLDINGNFGNL